MKHLLLSILSLICTITIYAQTVTIIEGSTYPLYAHSLSSDGQYVAGQAGLGTSMAGNHAFVWTKEQGLKELDTTGANVDGVGSTAWGVSLTGRLAGVSPDATRLVDDYSTPDTSIKFPFVTAAFRDNAAETWTILPLLDGIATPFYGFGSHAHAISDDGNIIVGGQTAGGQAQRYSAGYWDVSDPSTIVWHALLPNQAGVNSMVQAVSGDGSVMGGQETENNFDDYTTLWINGIKKRINNVSGAPVKSISNNGKYAVFQNATKAVLYDVIKDEVNKFDTGTQYSTPLAVSNKGVVVGHWGSSTLLGGENRKAFIYTKTLGMIAFDEFLQSSGITSSLDAILVASGISADGTKVSGFGTKNGKIVSFYVEIPDVASGLTPVQDITAHTPVYGTINLQWIAPEASQEPDAPELTGYHIYDGETLLETVGNTITSHIFSSVADGTYHYSVKAVYDVESDSKESIAGKSVAITIGKKTIPFYDSFSNYQPGGYVFDLGRVMEEIPLSTGLWDVSANTVPFSNSWHVNQSGIPPYSAGFVAPQIETYSETLSSPYFDGRNTTDLFLAFEIYVPIGSSQNTEKLAVEIYADEEWHSVAVISAIGQTTNFTNRYYDVSQYAGKDNLRFRFRCFGSNGPGINWFIDNVELTDSEHQVTIEVPLVVSARKAEDNTVHINWSDPYGNVSLRYMLDDNAYGATVNDVVPYVAANMYPAEDLTAYEGYKLTSISFWRTDNSASRQPLTPPKFNWFVSQGGERLFSAEVVNPQLLWNTIQLDNPIAIDITKPLYYGVEVAECDPNDWPIGSGTYYVPGANENDPYVHLQKIDGRGNIYSEDNGQTWRKMSEDGEEYAADLFCIRATLSKEPSLPLPRRILGYYIYRNNESLIAKEWGSEFSVDVNNFTDTHPLPAGSEGCYTVKTSYAYYTGHISSDGVSDCLTINGIPLIQGTDGLKVYPNPIKSDETIQVEVTKLPDAADAIKIYTLTGKIVKEAKVNSLVTPVQLNVEAGTYILRVNDSKAVKLIVK